MKKAAALIAATAIVVYTGCAMLEEESGVVNSEMTSEISVEKESSIAVVVNGGNVSRAAIDITESKIIKASFELNGPNETIIQPWIPGEDTLYFNVASSGEYKLTVLEEDANGVGNYTEKAFSVKAGINYSIAITLGMNIDIAVNENGDTASAGHEYYSVVKNSKWYPIYDTVANSWSELDIDYDKGILTGTIYRDTLSWSGIIADPGMSLNGYHSVGLRIMNNHPVVMTLGNCDRRGYPYELTIPASDSIVEHVIPFDQFIPGAFHMGDSLDLNDYVEFGFATMVMQDVVKFYVEDMVLLD